MNSPSLYSGLLPKSGSTALVGASGGGGGGGSGGPWVILPDTTVGAQNNIEYTVPSTDVLLAGNATTTEGAGTRLAFVPAEGSFRAGTVTSSQWNAANRGAQSVAMGLNCSAIGAQSVALGNAATCSAGGSFCFSSADAATTSATANSFTVGASGGITFYTNAARSVINRFTAGTAGLTTTGAAANFGTADAQQLTIGTGGVTAITVDISQNTRFAGPVFGSTSINATTSMSANQTLLVGDNAGHSGVMYFYDAVAGFLELKLPSAGLTSSYALTLPGAQGAAGTVLANNGSGLLSWSTGTGLGFFQNSGNSFGAAGVLGTNDSNALSLRTAGTTALTISTAQIATFTNPIVIGTVGGSNGALSLTGATSGSVYVQSSSTGALTVATGGAPTTALTIDASQIATFYGPLVGRTTIYSGVIGSATGSLVLNSGTASGGSVTMTVGSMLAAASYTLTWPTSVGSSGQVMVNGGGGSLSWQSPGASSAFLQAASTQTIGTGTNTQMTYTTAVSYGNLTATTAGNYISVNAGGAGHYSITSSVVWSFTSTASATSYLYNRVYQSGSQVMTGTTTILASISYYTNAVTTGVLYLNVGDTIQSYVYQTTGSSQNISGSGVSSSYLTVTWIAP